MVHDGLPSLISLYFFQLQSLTVTDKWIAYAVETPSGPEIEARPITRKGNGGLDVGKALRLRLHTHDFLQASSIAVSPDGTDLAFVGLTTRGWANIYLVEDFSASATEIVPLTRGAYAWRNLTWDSEGLLVSSNRTPTSVFSLFRLDPKTGQERRITASATDQWSADARGGALVFQGWSSGSPQVHRLLDGKETRVTDVPTGLAYPRVRQGSLLALGFQGGRYRLLDLPMEGLLDVSVGKAGAQDPGAPPWTPVIKRFSAEEIHEYRPFRGGTIRLDGLFGYFGTGGVGGIFASVSDLVRDYEISAGFAAYGNIRTTSAEAFMSSQRGRATWTGGLYRSVQTRLDGMFSTPTMMRTYLQDEYGVVGAMQYPFNTFSFFDLQLRLAGVNRFDYSDPRTVDAWQATNPGRELMLAPALRLGYDRIVYEVFTGPLRGFGILGEGETSLFPERKALSQRFRLDVAQYFQLTGRSVLALQGIGGAAFGDTFNTSFFISSDDFFRAYSFGDPRLLGDYFLAGKGEVRFPIGDFFGFPPLRGLASYDIGTISQRRVAFGSNMTSAATWGFALNIPPLAISLLFSYPLHTAPGPVDTVVPHFTLRYLYL